MVQKLGNEYCPELHPEPSKWSKSQDVVVSPPLPLCFVLFRSGLSSFPGVFCQIITGDVCEIHVCASLNVSDDNLESSI